MKKASNTRLRGHPLAHQVFCHINGFEVEICRDRKSLNTAFRLRYRAYLETGAIPENEEEMLHDDYDFHPNAFTYLVWHQEKPVASIRSSIFSDQYDWQPVESIHYFAEDMRAGLGEKTRLLESARFVVDPDFQGRQSLFAQLLMFRAHGLNAFAHGCTYLITCVRAKHIPFYRRFLRMEQISSQMKYVPWADTDAALLAVRIDHQYREFVGRRGMPDFNEEDIANYAACAGISDDSSFKVA
jgi:hypothetical protein